MNKSSPQIFIYTFFGLSIPILFSIFIFNFLIDPLWHSQGNRLQEVNYAFNERHMKVNSYVNRMFEYNCILFGSSRSTLLDEKKIQGENCFNMSFSNGHIDEFIVIAKYIKDHGIKLKTIIFSVNEVSFTPYYQPNMADLPPFIYRENGSPSMLNDYLTISSLKFSYKTIRRKNYLPRAYVNLDGRGFKGAIVKFYAYKPSRNMKSNVELFKPYQHENIKKYKELIEMFPGVESLGLIAPLSNWEQARIHLMGNLSDYVKIRYELSNEFSEGIIDFSIPSEITKKVDNTYDGLHYNEEINDKIIDRVNDDSVRFGESLRKMTEDEYYSKIIPPVESFINRNKLTVIVDK